MKNLFLPQLVLYLHHLHHPLEDKAYVFCPNLLSRPSSAAEIWSSFPDPCSVTWHVQHFWPQPWVFGKPFVQATCVCNSARGWRVSSSSKPYVAQDTLERTSGPLLQHPCLSSLGTWFEPTYHERKSESSGWSCEFVGNDDERSNLWHKPAIFRFKWNIFISIFIMTINTLSHICPFVYN